MAALISEISVDGCTQHDSCNQVAGTGEEGDVEGWMFGSERRDVMHVRLRRVGIGKWGLGFFFFLHVCAD